MAALGSSRVEALIKNLAEAQEDDCNLCQKFTDFGDFFGEMEVGHVVKFFLLGGEDA